MVKLTLDENIPAHIKITSKYFSVKEPIERPKRDKTKESHSLKRAVYQYTKSGEYLGEYESIGQASRESDTLVQSLSRCVRGLQKSAGGFGWKYKD